MWFMNIKQFIQKHRILTCCEWLLIILSLVTFLIPLHSYHYDGQDFETETGIYLDGLFDVTQSGYYMDSSIYDAEEALATENIISNGIDGTNKFSIYSPKTDLRFGSYDITFRYLNGSSGNTYTCLSEYNTIPVIVGKGNISLNESTNSSDYVTISLKSFLNTNEYQVAFNFRGDTYLFVYGLDIQETSFWKWFIFLFSIAASISLDLIINLWEKEDTKSRGVFIALTTILVMSLLPLMGAYTPAGLDSSFHYGRLIALEHAIMERQIPARVITTWLDGLGYAASVFYCDIFLLPASILMLLGSGIQAAYKFYIFYISLLTLIITYKCLKRIFDNNTAAVLGTAVYMLSPNRLVSIYTRASLGEYSALAFYPLILLGLYNIYTNTEENKSLKARIRRIAPLITGACGLLWCHVLSVVMASIFCLIVLIILWKKTFTKNTLADLITSLCAIISMSLWYIVPFIHMMSLGIGSMNSEKTGRFRSNGAYFWQIINMFPKASGFSLSVEEGIGLNQSSEMSYAVGPALLTIVIYLIIRSVFKVKGEENPRKLADLTLFLAILSTYMTTIYFPWDFINQLGSITSLITKNIQFPWRFTSPLSLFLAILSGCIYVFLKENQEETKDFSDIFSTALLVLMGICASYYISLVGDSNDWAKLSDMEKNINTSVMGGEYLLSGTDLASINPSDVICSTGVEASGFRRNHGKIYVTLTNSTENEAKATVPFLYYIGYKAKDMTTGQKYAVSISENNLVNVSIPANYQGEICVFYSEPLLWRICECISVLTLMVLICILMSDCYKTNAITLIHPEQNRK